MTPISPSAVLRLGALDCSISSRAAVAVDDNGERVLEVALSIAPTVFDETASGINEGSMSDEFAELVDVFMTLKREAATDELEPNMEDSVSAEKVENKPATAPRLGPAGSNSGKPDSAEKAFLARCCKKT